MIPVRQLLLSLAILLSVAVASADSHRDAVLAAVSSIPAVKADRTGERAERRAQLVLEFAEAIAEVSAKRPEPRKYAALLATILERESHIEVDVIEGRCPPHRCDHGRARGGLQGHDFPLVHDLWIVANGNPRVQVEMADRVLSRAVRMCTKQAPWPASALRAYRGGANGSCTIALADEKARVATYHRMLGVMAKGMVKQ